MIDTHQGLPNEAADSITKPFARFLKIEAAAGGLLLAAVLLALALANSPWQEGFLGFWETPIGLTFGSLDFTRSLRHWINDGLMTLFFFVLSLELKRELVLGELRNPRQAALPFVGALGGMVVPVSLYLVLMSGQPGMHGWGTVMATDTAFVIGCLALFGRRIPPTLRLFLLSLAIFDDVGAILVVAFGYGEALNWSALGLGFLGICIVAGASRLGIRSVPVYFLLGAAVWLCFDASGVHATIAGVILGLMTPTRIWVSDARLREILGRVLAVPTGDRRQGNAASHRDLRQAGRAVTESLSPVERLEMMLHPLGRLCNHADLRTGKCRHHDSGCRFRTTGLAGDHCRLGVGKTDRRLRVQLDCRPIRPGGTRAGLVVAVHSGRVVSDRDWFHDVAVHRGPRIRPFRPECGEVGHSRRISYLCGNWHPHAATPYASRSPSRKRHGSWA